MSSIVGIRLTLLSKDKSDQPIDMSVGQSADLRFDSGTYRRGSVLIGRAPEVDFRVNAPTVGRRVVLISLRDEGLWIEDLGSGGGSSLESSLDIERHRSRHFWSSVLGDGSVLWIGEVPFEVSLIEK